MSKKLPGATHEGVIILADGKIEISCAVLEDGRRLITQSGFMKALGRARQAKGRQYYDADVNMPAFLTAKNLKPFIPSKLGVTSSQIEFNRVKGGAAYGYADDLLPTVCEVFIDAEDAGELTKGQLHIAAQARLLIRGLAHVGIAALIDEATGYQEVRDRKALQDILDRYLLAERAKWAKRFPDSFYKEIFRLRGWQWQGMSVNRPQVVGHYTNDIVWDRLAPGIKKELKKQNPKSSSGKRQAKHHQWLTDDIGHPSLQQHLVGVMAIMRGALNWTGFQRSLQRAYPKVNTNLELPLGGGHRRCPAQC